MTIAAGTGPAPALPALEPPTARIGPLGWARANLFSSSTNGLLSLLLGGLAALGLYRLGRFVFVTAEWEVVRRNLRLLMVGRSFPTEELWRPWAGAALLAVAIGFGTGSAAASAADVARSQGRAVAGVSRWEALRRNWPVVALVVALFAFITTPLPYLGLAGVFASLVVSRAAGRAAPTALRSWSWLVILGTVISAYVVVTGFGGVPREDWGGLLLSLAVTVAGIVLAFPLGLVLALGRRSVLPALRGVCSVYIEIFRGVPLVALLFMSQFLVGFLFPSFVEPPQPLTRALLVIVAFEAAYLAEVVRGGLQGVPRGQIEAAQAIGLGPFALQRRIVLPQALRSVLPGIVGQFISLFKDTSLLSVVGFVELLDVAQFITSQPDFAGRGLSSVTLAFAGFVYWVGAYTMSRESRRLERRLGVGTR